jgi:type I restriction enzyme S subunit
LNEIITFRGGGTPRKDVPEYWTDEIPWASVKDFKSLDLSHTQDSISRKGLEASASNLIPAGNVIIPTRMALGKAAINSIDLAINQDLRALIPKVPLDSRYLLHSMIGLADEIVRYGSGATVKGITQENLGKLQIPLPPLAEQKRIAAILDAADALRTQRREALAQLDALLQSTFLTLFGDPVTNPMGWERKKFSQIGSLDRGVSKHRPRNAPELLGGPYPLVQTGEVANCDTFIRDYKNTYSEIGLNQSKLWPAGTLCITIAANIAKTGILRFEACFPDSVVGFRADDPATVYFAKTWLSFLQKMLEETAPESAQKNINLEILRNLVVPLPPLPLQQKFAAIVESTERQKATQRAHLAELDALFAALQHRAFRGELRFIEP